MSDEREREREYSSRGSLLGLIVLLAGLVLVGAFKLGQLAVTSAAKAIDFSIFFWGSVVMLYVSRMALTPGMCSMSGLVEYPWSSWRVA